MSESENTSTQEKLDVWFASLQLDKPAPLTKKEKFFRWWDKNMYLIILIFILVLPIISYAILYAIEYHTNLFFTCGFTKNEWFLFLGSYFGGVATFFSVIKTITTMNKSQIRQEKIALIDKEYNAIVNLISKIKSLYSCAKRYHTFEGLDHVDKIQCIEHLQKTLLNILENIDSFEYELNRTSMVSSILNIDSKCMHCKTKCNTYIIKNNFNQIFEIEKFGSVSINDYLYQTLSIKFYILKTELNIDNNKYGIKEDANYQKINETLEKSLTLKSTLVKKIDEFFSKWEPENLEKMKILLNHYREEQIKSISHPCPYNEN